MFIPLSLNHHPFPHLMNIGYTQIYWQGKTCHQFSLLILTSFIGQFVHPVEWEGTWKRELDRGSLIILASCEFYFICFRTIWGCQPHKCTRTADPRWRRRWPWKWRERRDRLVSGGGQRSRDGDGGGQSRTSNRNIQYHLINF